MNHVSPLASDLGQAVHTSLLLAQLGKARARQRLLGQVSQPLGGQVDCLVEFSHADQQIHQHLCRHGRLEIVVQDRLDLLAKMADRRIHVLAQEGAKEDAVVLEGVLEGGHAFELKPRRKPAPVLGQVDGKRESGRVGNQDRVADRRRQVRDVGMVRLIGEEPVTVRDQLGDRRRLARHGMSPLGQVGTNAENELSMEMTDQSLDAGGLDCRVAGRNLLEGRDGRAGTVMVQNQLEPSPGVGTLVEGDIDDLSQPLCVLVRLVLVERGLDGLWLGDDPEIGPRGGDLSGGQELRADQPDRLDVPVLELRFGTGSARFERPPTWMSGRFKS